MGNDGFGLIVWRIGWAKKILMLVDVVVRDCDFKCSRHVFIYKG